MKLFLLFSFFVLVAPAITSAISIDPSCFRTQSVIPSPTAKSTLVIITATSDIYPQQDGNLALYKEASSLEHLVIPYDIVTISSPLDAQGYFDQYDTVKQMTIKFHTLQRKQTFSVDTHRNDVLPRYEISPDGQTWYPVDVSNLTQYDLQYLRMTFAYPNQPLTPVRVNPLNAFIYIPAHKRYIYTQSANSLILYTDYRCLETSYSDIYTQSDSPLYKLSASTPAYTPTRTGNPGYNKNFDTLSYTQDRDKDGIYDSQDNCIDVSNPDQKDRDADGDGDMCSDDDYDGRRGKDDNCLYIYNPDQKDVNTNTIGDACEIDTDKDTIYDSIDNCPVTANTDQRDIDHDGLGNACDNCPSKSNINQRDQDADTLGDLCDAKDDRFLESNRPLFFGIAGVVIALFAALIWYIYRTFLSRPTL